MPDPSFSQPERRSLILPIVLGLALLGVIFAVVAHLRPTASVAVTHVHTDLLPTSTVFKSDSIVMGPRENARQLFVATTVRIDNKIHIPIYLDDFTCTFTDPSGAIMKVTAFANPDLTNIQTSFPKLQPLMQTPLKRETRIDPGQTLQGTILLSFPFTEAQWNARKSATIEIDLYHQAPLTLDIPK
ncbi:hypothetical protein [Granulicella tundricola]|uniref:DUF4352 domain-containing protein n=1 Tax=Granulicella tundricola (strain ATCC BAA-1859 / DSM 23138 / MP5ACTX9) TaxID=1198114 RepID=E8X583_GRATM|nr:hypothetical protein [Granulicella tundricola]ADW68347.1 hypothetical protein AciX9_1285 [Granulicella tundricola MP5ACTX9]